MASGFVIVCDLGDLAKLNLDSGAQVMLGKKVEKHNHSNPSFCQRKKVQLQARVVYHPCSVANPTTSTYEVRSNQERLGLYNYHGPSLRFRNATNSRAFNAFI